MYVFVNVPSFPNARYEMVCVSLFVQVAAEKNLGQAPSDFDVSALGVFFLFLSFRLRDNHCLLGSALLLEKEDLSANWDERRR